MELLSKAAERKGDKRSAAGNEQGNQKTPAMVRAILTDALAQLESEDEPTEGSTAPRGGFTDVGLHTGGHARNTAWRPPESCGRAAGHALDREAIVVRLDHAVCDRN